jgi:hypothetical protein
LVKRRDTITTAASAVRRFRLAEERRGEERRGEEILHQVLLWEG